MQEAYIVAGYRTAVGKSKKGGFRFYRPDDLAVEVIKALKESKGELEAILIWEGGDISRLTVKDGLLKDVNIEL